jgi:uncharacterized protein YecE (DUF72 family)
VHAIRIGCAGWALPPPLQPEFPGDGSHLERYARVFAASEINSSFHRPHRPATYARWAAAVPPDFGFCAKLPKAITHERRLVDCREPLADFMAQACGLGPHLRCLLVQLPPSLAFEPGTAARFLGDLRALHAGAAALEPRHASWFSADADALLAAHQVARVLADPVRHPPGAVPGGWPGLVYLRLHGSPRVYYSAYGDDVLQALASRIRLAAGQAQVWCSFDNTASGAAASDALRLQRLLAQT